MHKRVEKMRYILEKTREAKEQRAVTEDGNPRKHTSSFSSFLLLSPSPRAKLIRRLRFGEEKIIYVFGGVLQLVPSNMCYILRDVKIACQRKMTQVEVGMFTEDLGE